MSRRRRFGRVRRLPSGRWQVRYRTDDGGSHTGPHTFLSRADAERYLAEVDLAMHRGGWVHPDAGAVLLRDYVEQWLAERPVPLRPRTEDLYRGLLRRHILPSVGQAARATRPRVQPKLDDRSRP